VYENPKTNETFKVSYNSIKGRNTNSKNEGSKTITQKPDNILSINKLGCDVAYEFVFDAKYKIDTSQDYQDRYKRYGEINVEDI
jgi:hypothetical protein